MRAWPSVTRCCSSAHGRGVESGGGACGGVGLVTGQHLGPVADALVGGDEDGPALVTIGDQAEEEVGILAGERLEADLIDDEEGGVHVLSALEVRRRHAGISSQVVKQFLNTVEDDGEAAFDGGDAKAGSEMALADAWWPEQEQRLPITDPLGGGQGLDLPPLDSGLKGEVAAGRWLARRRLGRGGGVWWARTSGSPQSTICRRF